MTFSNPLNSENCHTTFRRVSEVQDDIGPAEGQSSPLSVPTGLLPEHRKRKREQEDETTDRIQDFRRVRLICRPGISQESEYATSSCNASDFPPAALPEVTFAEQYQQPFSSTTCAGSLRTGHWSAKEDRQLLQQISLHNNPDWDEISSLIGTRSPPQCRERYTQLRGAWISNSAGIKHPPRSVEPLAETVMGNTLSDYSISVGQLSFAPQPHTFPSLRDSQMRSRSFSPQKRKSVPARQDQAKSYDVQIKASRRADYLFGECASADFQAQLRSPVQQNNKRKMATSQRQLMLLEKQNKRRLVASSEHARLLLVQRDKKRRFMASHSQSTSDEEEITTTHLDLSSASSMYDYRTQPGLVI